MGIYRVKPGFQQLLSPIKTFLVRHKVHPTVLNLLGFLLSLVAGALLYFSSYSAGFLAAVPFLVFLRIALNALDGLVARELGVASRAGEVLNEFCDRLSDLVIFLGLALAPFANHLLGSVTIMLILLVSYLGTLSKAAGGSRQYGGVMGKGDRMLYLGLTSLVVLMTRNPHLWNHFFVFILLGVLVTIVQRFLWIMKELR